MKKSFPSTSYNPISALGAGLALFGFAAIVILYVLDALSHETNPYLGIFIFMIFPGILVAGLLLIPVGMLWEKRRRKKGKSEPVVIDLGKPQHRNALAVFVAGSSVFLLLTTIGLYGTYEYSESVEFCGEVCHTVMEPEAVAHANSPHAKVKCVTCHIGPGAGWYVKSKVDGARQVIAVLRDSYSRPIETPIEHLRPAREVCEQCHWPEKYFSSKAEVWNYFLGDEENTHWQIWVTMHIGGVGANGEASGSHWHIDPRNHLVYVAADHDRTEIEQLTWYRDGDPVVYSLTGKPLPDSVVAERRLKGQVREMDCMDCHNRPAHHYNAPMEAVGQALAAGVLDPDLPWIKRRAVAALSQPYASKEGARDSISHYLESAYAVDGTPLPEGTDEAVFGIYEKNFFPAMNVSWEHYPDHRSHLNFPGCFRCHGSDLRTETGRTISADCNTCHTILAQGPVDEIGNSLDRAGLPFRHPIDIGGAETRLPCTDCHLGNGGVYLPRPAEISDE